MENVAHEPEKAISGAIKIDEKEIQDHIDGLVRQSVEDTLNALLNAEADAICNASRYQRTSNRLDTRAGSYHRKLLTKAGEVDLKVPRLRSLPFETEIIRRYQTKQSSVEEALIEMYLAGVSVRRVEDITEALWGAKVSPSTVSDLNQKIYGKIEEWRMRPITDEYPYVFVDGVYLKGSVRYFALLIAYIKFISRVSLTLTEVTRPIRDSLMMNYVLMEVLTMKEKMIRKPPDWNRTQQLELFGNFLC